VEALPEPRLWTGFGAGLALVALLRSRQRPARGLSGPVTRRPDAGTSLIAVAHRDPRGRRPCRDRAVQSPPDRASRPWPRWRSRCSPRVARADFNYSVYSGTWNSIPGNFGSAVATGTSPVIDLSVTTLSDNFGLVFTGTITVSQAGTYLFSTPVGRRQRPAHR
jgi:hypothetical protein